MYIVIQWSNQIMIIFHQQNRMWRKTRKPYGLFCKGSDPNRNWSFKVSKYILQYMSFLQILINKKFYFVCFSGCVSMQLQKQQIKNLHHLINKLYIFVVVEDGGASSSPCAETYAGSEPFSCPETRSLSQYITSISDKFYAYISFHSYSQLLMFPYGHTTAHLENYDDLVRIGTLSKIRGFIFFNLIFDIYLLSVGYWKEDYWSIGQAIWNVLQNWQHCWNYLYAKYNWFLNNSQVKWTNIYRGTNNILFINLKILQVVPVSTG